MKSVTAHEIFELLSSKRKWSSYLQDASEGSSEPRSAPQVIGVPAMPQESLQGTFEEIAVDEERL